MVAKHHLLRASQLANSSMKWLTENDRSASIRELDHHNKTMIVLEKEILSEKDHKKVNSVQLKGDYIKVKEREMMRKETNEIRELNHTVHLSKPEFKEEYAKVIRPQETTESDDPAYSEQGKKQNREHEISNIKDFGDEPPNRWYIGEDNSNIDHQVEGDTITKHIEIDLPNVNENNATDETSARTNNQSDDGSKRLKPIQQLKTELIGSANELQVEVNSVHLSYETRKITNIVIQQALKWLNTTQSTSISELNYFERTLQTHRVLIYEELNSNEKEMRRNPTDELPSEIYHTSKEVEKLPVREEPIYDEIRPVQSEELDSFQEDVYNIPKPLPSLSDNKTSSMTIEKQSDKADYQEMEYAIENEFARKEGYFYQNVYENTRKINEDEEETLSTDSGRDKYTLSKSKENTQDKIVETD